MTSVENLEFTEAFKNPLHLSICLCGKKVKSMCLSKVLQSLKADSLKIHAPFLKSAMCHFSKQTLAFSCVIIRR